MNKRCDGDERADDGDNNDVDDVQLQILFLLCSRQYPTQTTSYSYGKRKEIRRILRSNEKIRCSFRSISLSFSLFL